MSWRRNVGHVPAAICSTKTGVQICYSNAHFPSAEQPLTGVRKRKTEGRALLAKLCISAHRSQVFPRLFLFALSTSSPAPCPRLQLLSPPTHGSQMTARVDKRTRLKQLTQFQEQERVNLADEGPEIELSLSTMLARRANEQSRIDGLLWASESS